MIVQCVGCKTRFRLAKERVRPAGTRVRCSRCGTTFLVRAREGAGGAAPPTPSPLPQSPALPAVDEPSFNEMHTEVGAVPRELLDRMRDGGACSQGPQGPGVDAPGEEATCVAQLPRDLLDDPRFDDSRFDDDGLPPPPAPTRILEQPREEPPADGDLFGDLDFGDAPPPLPSVKLPQPPPVMDDPLEILGPGPALAPLGTGAAPPAPAPPPVAEQAAAWEGEERGMLDPGGLQPPPGDPAARLELDEGGWTPPAPDPAAQGPAFEQAPSGLELASEEARRPPPPAAQQRQQQGGAPASVPLGRATPPAERGVTQRGERAWIRAASGAAVLASALLAFLLLRGGGTLPRSGDELFSILRAGVLPAAVGELQVGALHGGSYPGAAGDLYLVRGEVGNHAAAELGPAVRVVAELRDGAEVVARGTAWAGGEPTPEEVHALGGVAAWERLAARLGAGWATPIAPGESLPFLVVLGPTPARLDQLRLEVRAAAAPAPASGRPAVAADRP